MHSAAWGSAGVIEEVLGGRLGSDITRATVASLDIRTGRRLVEALLQVNPARDLGLRGSRTWADQVQLNPSAALLCDFAGSSKFVTSSALYLPQILIPDPVRLPQDPLASRSDLSRTLNNLSYDVDELTRLRPLIDAGVVLLYPSWVGAGAPTQAAEAISASLRGGNCLDELMEREAEAMGDLWGTELNGWVERLWARLPQGQAGETADFVIARLLAASAFDVEFAAVGREASMLPDALTTAGAASSSLCDLLVPQFRGISAEDVVSVRRDSEVLRRLRDAFDEVARALPEDTDRARRKGPQIAGEILGAFSESLRTEVRASPTLSAMAGAGWVLTCGVVEMSQGGGSATVMAMAGAPVPVIANWIVARKRSEPKRAARRVIRTFETNLK